MEREGLTWGLPVFCCGKVEGIRGCTVWYDVNNSFSGVETIHRADIKELSVAKKMEVDKLDLLLRRTRGSCT